jgi:hypothetical protein
MNEPIIHCPNCKTEIKLTESLAGPLIEATRKKFEKQLAAKDSEIKEREAALKAEADALEEAKGALDEEVAAKVKAERTRIAAEEAKKAKLLVATEVEQKAKELADLQDVLRERDKKLAEAQKAQAELIQKQRELDDARREMDLTVQKKVQENLDAVRSKAKQEAEDALGLKVLEKEQQIAGMQRQIEDLKRKAEQGSQQLQGEVLELQLEGILRARFPTDVIEPVPKGEFGGDVVQKVIGPTGQICGTILWESKRTKNWSDGWLAKLRNDMRNAKAEVAVLVTQALPKGVENFDQLDGIWVTDYRCAVPVALTLRHSLIELSAARQAADGQQSKAIMVYQYLTGPRFRNRVEAIVEKFSDMQDDLDKERKAITRMWAKREEQIRIVIESTAGMYGDLQGIAGRTLQGIEGLEVPLLDAPEDR